MIILPDQTILISSIEAYISMPVAESRMLDRFPDNDRFERVRRIGAGAMGIVYEAHDKERGANVALKVLKHSPSGQTVLSFKNEFRGFQGIDHPNLVKLYELIEHHGSWFFTMELVDGVDFLEWVRPSDQPWLDRCSTEPAIDSKNLDGASQLDSESLELHNSIRSSSEAPLMRLDSKRLRDSLRQLAEGLIILHGKQIVHRDIKPSNVLVTASGRVVLMDFGLSIRAGMKSERVIGTPNYMSPEQVRKRDVTPASDWYSVGVLLYRCLTGRLPFEGTKAMAEKLKRIPELPSVLVPDVDKELESLCMGL